MRLNFFSFVIFVFFLILNTNSFILKEECTNSTYKKTGDSCSESSGEFCKIFNVCLNNKCKQANIGDKCEKDTDCYLSYGTEQSIKCIQNQCTKRRYNGEPCEINEHVISFKI
jgi:hypothetical protein